MKLCVHFLWLGLGIQGVDAPSWVCLGFLIDLASFEMSIEPCVFLGLFSICCFKNYMWFNRIVIINFTNVCAICMDCNFSCFSNDFLVIFLWIVFACNSSPKSMNWKGWWNCETCLACLTIDHVVVCTFVNHFPCCF
jgi:hypothetical protein